jgi:Holliday junction resolvase RusA-like endonuclease
MESGYRGVFHDPPEADNYGPCFSGSAVLFSPPKAVVEFYAVYPHTSKPDSDNLMKAVMDAMTTAGVWKDDALVYGHFTEKWYSRAPSGARIIVKVRTE